MLIRIPPRPLLPHSLSIQCYEWATRRCYMDSSLKNRIVEEKLYLKIGNEMNGGAMENRTPDLRVANENL